jgi:hypothetical protein
MRTELGPTAGPSGISDRVAVDQRRQFPAPVIIGGE